MKTLEESFKSEKIETWLDINFFNSDKWKTPFLFETWNWEGDETILPYKLLQLAKLSKILSQFSSEEKFKEYLKLNYYMHSDFDKKSFYFITHRSDTAGCVYVSFSKEEKCYIIDFLIVNDKKYKNKGIEEALINLAIKRAIELEKNIKNKNDSDNLNYINDKNFINEIHTIKIRNETSNIKIEETLNKMGLLLN
jgi:hypothetical protein